MTRHDILEKLRESVLLADGAIGTLLVSRGASPDGPRSPLYVSAPDLVREVHDDYVAAGARILTTNTWDANRVKLATLEWADSLEKINREGVRLARAAAEGEYVFVVGSTRAARRSSSSRTGSLTKGRSGRSSTSRPAILLEDGVDLIVLETFSSELETAEAVRAVRGALGRRFRSSRR